MILFYTTTTPQRSKIFNTCFLSDNSIIVLVLCSQFRFYALYIQYLLNLYLLTHFLKFHFLILATTSNYYYYIILPTTLLLLLTKTPGKLQQVTTGVETSTSHRSTAFLQSEGVSPKEARDKQLLERSYEKVYKCRYKIAYNTSV